MVRGWLALTLAARPALVLGLSRVTQEYPVHDALELEPGQMAEFIATGVMPPLSAAQLAGNVSRDGEDPEAAVRAAAAQRAIDTVHSMASYMERLKAAEQHAKDARAFVLAKEEQLERDFAPSLGQIERMTREAVTAAAQAEVRTMKERLLRMHYKQVAAMDRQASFWEDRVAVEQQLRGNLDEAIEEQHRLRDVATPAAYEDAQREVASAQAIEQERLHKWLRGFAVSLKEEEDKANADGTLAELAQLQIPILPNETFGGWIPSLRSEANRSFVPALRKQSVQSIGSWIPVADPARNQTFD